ncbi:MAG: DUF3619 family protein [Methylophilaceae bacterium]|jgi:hypothetical protein|nr:DUF3619 family protein [Methylophilaceae bacterium]
MKTEQDKAKEIIDLLDEGTARLDRKVLDRLYAARTQAVGQLVERRQLAAQREADGVGHVLRMTGDYLHQHRAIMPAIMIISAALLVFAITQQMMPQPAVEQGDAFLLGAELPPEAFVDKGFDAWLARSSQR